MIALLPLLLFPIIVYNLAAPFVDMTTPLLWVLSLGDILTTLALVFVGVELWRSAAPTLQTAERQVANLALFMFAVLELVLAPWCRTGTFFILATATLITLVDCCYVAFTTKGTNVLVSGR
jgi:hypothetical protein